MGAHLKYQDIVIGKTVLFVNGNKAEDYRCVRPHRNPHYAYFYDMHGDRRYTEIIRRKETDEKGTLG